MYFTITLTRLRAERLVSHSEATTPALVVRSSAKSFSAGSHQRPTSPSQPQDARGKDKDAEGPSPKEVKYDNINQFLQVVELYRGRWAPLENKYKK
jgi:hypothetical protein